MNRTARSGNLDIDGLLLDYQWSRLTTLRFSFPTTVFQWTGYGAAGLQEAQTATAFNSRQQAAVTYILTSIEGLVEALGFAAGTVGNEAAAELRFGMTEDTEGAHAYTPFPTTDGVQSGTGHVIAGDVWFSSLYGEFDNPVAGNFAYSTFLHEIGHALGLNHPHDGDVYGTVSAKYDNMNYTVMTYRSYEGMPVEAPYHNEEFGYPQTFMLLDIAALQHMYGADFNFNAGNTNYLWTELDGSFYVNGNLTLDPGANKIFMTLWDGNGIDTYDFSMFFSAVRVDLEPGAWSITNPSQRADLGDGRVAIGNIANAWLYQGDTRSLIENAFGGKGDDTLLGNQAANSLSGMNGDDILDGRTGADTMAGGAGNDSYHIDNAGDVAFEGAGLGDRDRVYTTLASYTLHDNVELLTGAGNGIFQRLTGNAGANTITVSFNAPGAYLDGGAGADTLEGSFGNDTFVIDNAGDKFFGYGGTDSVESWISYKLPDEIAKLTLLGTAAIDGTGHVNSNILIGNDAANVLNGGGGDDILEGRGGDDTYMVDSLSDQVVEAAFGGADLVYSTVTYTLPANVEDLVLEGTAAINGTGNSEDNWLYGNDADNILDGKGGADVMGGGSGNDTYVVDHFADEVTEGLPHGQSDTVLSSVSYTLRPYVENLVLTGSGSIDATGNDLANSLTGNTGFNTLDGKAGADSMAGGQGNDIYVVDDAGDTVFEADASGTDTVSSGVSYTLGANVEQLRLTGTAVRATGNALGNVIEGNAAANIIEGAGGADTLTGGGGADTFVYLAAAHSTSAASDRIRDFQVGIDKIDLAALGRITISFSQATDAGGAYTIVSAVTAAAGTLTLRVDAIVTRSDFIMESPAGTAGPDTLVGTAEADELNGEGGDDIVQGLGANDILTGGEGHDRLDGGTGQDRMTGGAGDDTFVVDEAGDVVIEAVNEGTDEIRTGLWKYSLQALANVEKLTGTSASGQSLFGNDAANTITGGNGADTIDGLGGADRMIGGADGDVYFVDNIGDVVEEVADAASMPDLVVSAISYTLGEGVEQLKLSGTAVRGTGNALGNAIEGNNAANIIEGAGGADMLWGGGGADTFLYLSAAHSTSAASDRIRDFQVGSDKIDLSALGRITVSFSQATDAATGSAYTIVSAVTAASGTLTLRVDAIVARSDFIMESTGGTAGPDTLVGTPGMDELNGEGGDDIVQGLGADDILLGGDGNDRIDGGTGQDRMTGGTGDDTFVVDDLGDVVVEDAGAAGGTDTIESSISLVLPMGVENLTLVASAANATGNAAGNRLVGNAMSNVIDGGTGADVMEGGEGDDVFYIDNPGDQATDNGSGAYDRAFSSVSFTLSAGIEYLTLTGTAAINGTGNASSNLIVGNAAANILDGGFGADTLRGGAGDDRYVVDDRADTVIELAGEGIDTVVAWSGWTLDPNTENLVLIGPGIGTGNDGANLIEAGVLRGILQGLGGDDVLKGGADADILVGGSGADSLSGGAGADRFLYHAIQDSTANAVDRITGFESGSDTLDLLALGPIKVVMTPVTENGIAFTRVEAHGAQGTLVVLVNGAILLSDILMENGLVGGPDADTIDGTEASDEIRGEGGDDILRGLSGDDLLFGGEGQDDLDGGTGKDVMRGGAGEDAYRVDSLDDQVIEDAAGGTNDIVYTALAAYTLPAQVERLVGVSAGAQTLTGNESGNSIRGGEGGDTIHGLGGSDEIEGNGGNDALHGGDAGDALRGGAGDDLLIGGGGQDALVGGAGNDTMRGDSGDSFFGADGDDRAEVDGGTGLAATPVTTGWLGAGFDHLVLDYSQFTGAVIFNTGGQPNRLEASIYVDSGGSRIATIHEVDLVSITTGSGDDHIAPRGAGDTVNSGAGNDRISMEGSGSQWNFVGGLRIDGGSGLDRALLNWSDLGAADAVVWDSANAAGLVIGSGTALRSLVGVEILERFESGAADDRFTLRATGDGSIRQTISTNAGNDRITLVGGATQAATGAFALDLGTGSADELVMDFSAATQALNVTGGYFYTLGGTFVANASNFELLTIIGGSANDILRDREGPVNTRLSGGAGDDLIASSGGSDIVEGGAGSDRLEVSFGGSNGLSLVVANTLNPGGGYDGSFSGASGSVTYSSIEHFTIEGGFGNDTIVTRGGNDVLSGGSGGSDQLSGGAGDDLYLLDTSNDVVTELAGEGMDEIRVYSSSYTLAEGVHVEKLTASYPGGMTLVANSLNNILTGAAGDDTLVGGAGADAMRGGQGSDSYYVTDPSDLVEELANEGTDRVYAATSGFTLGANFEQLFSYSAPFGQTLTGNGLANLIVGSAYADAIDGKAGADWMNGGDGNDTYFIDDAGDFVEESVGMGGADEVRTGLGAYTLTANVERLVSFGATGGQTLIGNALANYLQGSAFGDLLDGGAGADQLAGGIGDDVYLLDNMGDTVVETAGQGIDEVRTTLGSRTDFSQMFVLAANVERLTGTSASGQGVYANALDNVVTMGAGGDLVVLDGGGNDRVSGGGGDDFLYYGAAFTGADMTDGGAGYDTLGLLGTYSVVFDADDLVSIEKLAVYSSGNPAAPNAYSLTTMDANVAAGQQLMVVAQSLAANEAFHFNGAAETDGSFNVRGGRGGDAITGGAKGDLLWGGLGADQLRGGAGNDVFQYESAADSTGSALDTILDFTKGDRINLSPIDADGNAANGDSKFTWLGAGAFTGQAGQLRVTQHPQLSQTWRVEADLNGDGAADLVIHFAAPPGFLPEKSDFYL